MTELVELQFSGSELKVLKKAVKYYFYNDFDQIVRDSDLTVANEQIGFIIGIYSKIIDGIKLEKILNHSNENF